jgi:hypothetical protein
MEIALNPVSAADGWHRARWTVVYTTQAGFVEMIA